MALDIVNLLGAHNDLTPDQEQALKNVNLSKLTPDSAAALLSGLGIDTSFLQQNAGKIRAAMVKKAKKYPVNSPCPCESGLKFKKCCGVTKVNPITKMKMPEPLE